VAEEVPVYIVAGDHMVSGTRILGGVNPHPELSLDPAAVQLWTSAANDHSLNKTVPSDASGLAPASPAYYPYADHSAIVYQGTATSGGASSISRTGAGWVLGSLVGRRVVITAGTGVDQTATIAANTADTITTVAPWTTAPDNTSVFEVVGAYVVYHQVSSRRAFAGSAPVPFATGDNSQYTGLGLWGLTRTLMSELEKRHPDGFRCFKFQTQSGFEGMANPAGAPWIEFADAWNRFRRLLFAYQGVATAGSTDTITVSATVGTATGGTTTTLVHTGAGWGANQHVGRTVTITAGTGSGQSMRIVSNNATTLVLASALTIAPAADSQYRIAWVPSEFVGHRVYIGQGAASGQETTVASNSDTSITFASSLSTAADNTSYFRVLEKAVIKWIHGDYASTDIANNSVALYTAIPTWGGLVRSLVGATAATPVSLANPHPRYMAASRAQTTATVRRIIDFFSKNISGAKVVDMSGFTLTSGLPAEPSDATEYSTIDHIRYGRMVAGLIDAHYTEAITATPGSGIPTYVMIGDSQGVGSMPPEAAFNEDVESLLGPYENPDGSGGGPSFVRANQWVWHGANQQIERYSVISNDNTLGTAAPYYGPSAYFMARLAERHPNGVLLLKYNLAGSALTLEALGGGSTGTWEIAGPLLNSAQSEFRKMASAAISSGVPTSLGGSTTRFVDLRGVAVLLGDNDTITEASSIAFGTKAQQFVDNIRTAFQTRSDGTLPVAWLLPPKHVDDAPAKGSTHGVSATARRAVRSAVQALEGVSVVNADVYEIQRGGAGGIYRVHWGGPGMRAIGVMLADALTTSTDGAGTVGTGTGIDSLTGGADTITTESASPDAGTGTDAPADIALVVEDGTGRSDADSYVTLAEADTYHLRFGNPDVWATATTAQRTTWLRTAAEQIDTYFGIRWRGYRATSTQALDWPQHAAFDYVANRIIEGTVVPQRVKKAQFLWALDLALGNDPIETTQVGQQGVEQESKTMAGGFSKSVTYTSGASGTPRAMTALFRQVVQQLSPLLAESGDVELTR